MTRNLKALGLALVAVFALGGVVASGASAQQGFLTSTGPVTLSGTENGPEASYVEAFGIRASCPGSTATGHKANVTPHEMIPSGASTFTVTPHIKQTTLEGKANCLPAGFPATTDFNGCDYVAHIGETTIEADTYAGTTDIVCPEGKEIVWTVYTTEAEDPSTPFCTYHIPPQTGLTGATAKDTTNGTINLRGAITGVRVTRTNHGAHTLLCPKGETTAAKWQAYALVAGLNELGEPTSIGLSHN